MMSVDNMYSRSNGTIYYYQLKFGLYACGQRMRDYSYMLKFIKIPIDNTIITTTITYAFGELGLRRLFDMFCILLLIFLKEINLKTACSVQ